MTSTKEYNLQFLKKSRLKSGDIFALRINNTYIFGRIVRTKLPFGESPFGGSNLIYLYDVQSSDASVDYSKLTPDGLLVPPMYVSDILWAKGYAIKVGNMPISDEDLLSQHCFYSDAHNKYYDDKGQELADKIELCGEWRYVVGMDYIDNKLSDALHIKRMPLTEDRMWYLSGKGEKVWLTQSLSELKKYANYEEVIAKYPEVVEER
jgi:immunity protein 26 of polymorphic toxin system